MPKAGSLHARQTGVANQVFLQISVDRALAAQPLKSTFRFMTQLNILNIAFASAALSLSFALDGDLDQFSTRTIPNVHAACRNKFSLVTRVAAEGAEKRGHVGIVHEFLVASKQARNVTASETGFTHNVSLLDVVPFGDAFQGCAEVAHIFLPDVSHFMGIPAQRNDLLNG